MGQNALGQLKCRNFESTLFPEQNYEIAWFFKCWYKFMEVKIWLKNIFVADTLGHGTLKCAVSQ